jgi:hypothetical protein
MELCNLKVLFAKLMYLVRLEVFTAVTMKNGVFCDVTPCGSCKNRRLGRNIKYSFAACVSFELQLALFLFHRFLSP